MKKDTKTRKYISRKKKKAIPVDRSVFLWPRCSLMRRGHTAVLNAAAVLIVTNPKPTSQHRARPQTAVRYHIQICGLEVTKKL